MSTPVSIQERLQLKRVPFDNWSVREQLCLASAVLCSGDQNWMSVSRSLKILCDPNRPPDWFSQKSCAAQYGKLLESEETPKRKKRTASERDSSTPVETPNETIVRKLTEERINELKRVMAEEQSQFQKLKEEILLVESERVTESQLRDMWASIEDEKRQEEVKKTNHDEWLKRREQRKLEMERAWRPGLAAFKAQQQAAKATPPIKKEEEVDEPGLQRSASGQSPLLTSLLKSPSSTSAPVTVTTPTTSRTTGPAQINLTATFDLNFTSDGKSLSASQTAPTLSMLLDKSSLKSKSQEVTSDENSLDITADIFPEQIPSVESGDAGDPKDDEQLMEVFKDLITDNIDELTDILTDNIPELLEDEVLEKVDELIGEEEAQISEPEPKMDTFDQLKNESILEEKKKREALAAAVAAAAKEEENKAASTSEDSRSMNISPDDSNQEDDIPLKVIQKDMLDAKKEEEKQPDVEDDRTTPFSEETFQEKAEVITDETSSTDPSGPIEVKQEPEEDDDPKPEDVKEEDEIDRKSVQSDEEIFEDAKEEPFKEDPLDDPLPIPTDTDDDSSSIPKDDNKTRSISKRDTPRRKTAEETLKSGDESDSRSSLATRTRSKEHERSESPLDEDSDNTPRRTRRYSSVNDSVPNSPVPEENKEQRAWRKQIQLAYGRITTHKNASVLNYLNKEDTEKKFKGAILRPIDMMSIKKNIDSGNIKTTVEFQRDIMLMCTNIMMTSSGKSSTYQQAHELMQESIGIIKTTMEGLKQEKETVADKTPTTPLTKRGSRKSQRLP